VIGVANAVEFAGLTHRFSANAAPALTELTTEVPAGEVTGLVGPDGAGKTTFLRLAAGLLRATEGRITVLGSDPVRMGAELRALIGYMPQKFGLYEDLTVRENLELYADLRGVTGTERATSFARLLEFTGLAPFTDRPAGKLSGGMKQKLGLACVLLGRPRLLLLDEPSVGVDPISRRELWQMVNALAADGLTIVWSTSYLDEAERCRYVILLNAGRVLFAGDPNALAGRIAGRSVQIAGIEHNRRAVLERALRAPEVIDGVIQGSRVRLVLRATNAPPALEPLDAGPSARIEVVPPRLEDAFVDMLGGGPGGVSPLAERMQRVTIDSNSISAVIEADALTKSFGAFTAAKDISFRVPQGEIFGLLGPNGAGKSTTFKMLCGLLVPTRGRARVMGIDLRQHASRARQCLGYMAQKFSLYGSLTVTQNLRFFSGVYGLSGAAQAARIRDMVDTFALGPYADVVPDSLSLGFKQRLALACALMHNPSVLFLDEPTSGVDPITRREFWGHINGVVQKGVTVMVTTHFMDEAEYCDRIGIVYQGELIAVGAPDELKRRAAGPQAPDPSLEDTFIALVAAHSNERSAAA
jgi:drug efflux transport system ATP-binding protein